MIANERLISKLQDVLKIGVRYDSNCGVYNKPHKFELCDGCGFPLSEDYRKEILEGIIELLPKEETCQESTNDN